MIIIILVCVGFGTSYHLTNAYGMTGSLLDFSELKHSRKRHDRHHNLTDDGVVHRMGIYIYNPPCIPNVLWTYRWCILCRYLFSTRDTQLMTATLNKFTQGAWFPFIVAVVMTSFMAFWRWGMTKKRAYELDRRVRLRELLRREGEIPTEKGTEGAFLLGSENRPPLEKSDIPDSLTSPTSPAAGQIPSTSSRLSTSANSMSILPTEMASSSESTMRRRQLFLRATDKPIARLPGVSIYYTNAPTSNSHAPCTFRHFLEHFPTLHSTCIFLHVRTAAQPHVPDPEKLLLEASPLWDGVWRGVYRVGYMETPDFTTAEFTLSLFEMLGRPVESLTHVLQYTALKARKENRSRGILPWIKDIPAQIRGWSIDVIWSGIDEAIGGVGKGWKVPVGEIVSVGALAEV